MEVLGRAGVLTPSLSSGIYALPSVLSGKALRPLAKASVAYASRSALPQQRQLHVTARKPASNGGLLGMGMTGSSIPSSYFQRPSLPANTIIRFVPQQTAWIVERMGKFNRILQPGLAILIPFLDKIAYVKSLKESAIEIPSQSAITADNVTLDLDGVLYTRVTDAYKARFATHLCYSFFSS